MDTLSPSTKSTATAPPAYEDLVPYYAELCALSELRKKPGFGIPLASGMGGHLLLYLNGVRVDRSSGYPVLEVTPPGLAAGRLGAAICANSHYRNANWAAVEDREFIFRGVLGAGETLTRDVYVRTQERAKALGLLDGIEFHQQFFKDKPAGMSIEDCKYELSIGTDYGSQFGRDGYRARVPLDAARMQKVVDFLNELNEPYRAGHRIYHWRLFNNNCVHMAHNALAAAGLWTPWAVGQSPILAAFRFPVPKNALVDLALRANDLPIEEAEALYADAELRHALIDSGHLPTGPAALTSTAPAIPANDLYDVQNLRLIFYDNPLWGRYRGWFRRILSEPRYTDLDANLRHFAQRYKTAARNLPRMAGGAADRAQFRDRYAQHIAAEAAKIAQWQAYLDTPAFDRVALPTRSVA